ncbi:hypothetical protein [Klebsiella variicola]|uniref:hypothetical protein n=1 Tax=Klebsiella variicola TaxID=244366 RepID=UPI00210ED7D2|nr:hypothetical protein [Klebsiella variicola]
MTSKLTRETLDDETLAELIAFRRSRVEYCQKEGLPYQKPLHDSMMLALEELQERRKPLQDKDLQGVIDALEHPAGINAAGKQVVRHALVEIQERRKADREPVAEVVSIYGDPEAFGEREIRPLVGIQQMPYGTKLYRHAQPAPEYPETLPCPVLLEPGLRFGKGIKTSTMLAALARRAVHESDMAALSPEERAEFQALIEDFKALIAQPVPVVPDSYVMVPMRLTAENGAKGALSGEFSETKFVNCPECFGDEECETCDGSGKIEITVPVTWTTIKAIWAKGVEHFTATPREVKGES